MQVARQVQQLPYPSLASSLLPQIHETESVLERALTELDQIHNWSAQDVNHEPLLHSTIALKATIPLWRQSMYTKLQQLWMDSTTQYGSYRGLIDTTLRKRHVSELNCVFPSLRSAPVESSEVLENSLLTADERRVMNHLRSLGLGYDKLLEGPKLRLTSLCLGQDREREVFDRISMSHGEQILAAKQDDVNRLGEHLKRTDNLLEALMQAVDRKVAAASRAVPSGVAYRHGGGVALPPSVASSNQQQQGGGGGSVKNPHQTSWRGGSSSARSDRTQVTQLKPMQPVPPPPQQDN